MSHDDSSNAPADAPSGNSHDDPLELQQLLVESSLSLLFETYDNAVQDGVKQPTVILLDCEDEIGGQIAEAWLGQEVVQDAIADGSDQAETTVYARAMSWKICSQQIPEAFEYLAPVFDGPPPADGFLVVSVTAGGASALTVPPEARE